MSHRPCVHCSQPVTSGRQRLCWRCFRNPWVRRLFPPDPRYLRRGHGIRRRRVIRAPWPTNAMPGTAEKIEVLRRRAAWRVELFHPDDATFGSWPLLPSSFAAHLRGE